MQYSSTRSIENEADSLEKSNQEQKEFLTSLGAQHTISLSYLADQLAINLPSEIRWTSLKLFPANTSGDNDRSRTFSNNEITVAGESQSSGKLNQWVSEINKHPFVGNASILKYSLNSENIGLFEIKILLK
jgi:Tfp pilus assembly protein PilN